MDIETIRDYCIRKKGTTEEFPFDNVTLVFKVMGKMYACIGLDNPEWLSLKCAPEYALWHDRLQPGKTPCKRR